MDKRTGDEIVTQKELFQKFLVSKFTLNHLKTSLETYRLEIDKLINVDENDLD